MFWTSVVVLGNFTEKVINFNPKKIVAVDISEQAIKKAKNNSNQNRKNIEYRVENCEDLSLNSNLLILLTVVAFFTI